MRRTFFTAILALALSGGAWGQGSTPAGSPTAVNGLGQPLPGAKVAVCTADPGATPVPPCTSTLATTYTDITLSVQCSGANQPLSDPGGQGTGCSNPGFVDSKGNVVAYAVAGTYWCEYYGNGIKSYVQPCIFPGTGGGGGGGTVGPGSTRTFPIFTSPTTIGNSVCDQATNSRFGCAFGISTETNALFFTRNRNGSTGTTANLLTAFDAAGLAINAQPTDTNNIKGIARSTGLAGSVDIAYSGQFPCQFDNQTAQGDWVTLGSGSQCHDAGAVQPSGVETVGKANSVNSGAGTQAGVDLGFPDVTNTSTGGGTGIVGPCANAGALAYYQTTGSTTNCDASTNTDGAGNLSLSSVATNGAADGNVQIFDVNGPTDNSLNITSSGGDSELDWLDSSNNVIGDLAFRSAFGNVRVESHAATAARTVSYVLISDPTEIASTCPLGVQQGCVLIDSLNTNFGFSAGLAANHSGGATWSGNSTGRTWVGVPDNAGNNFIFWPLQSGTVALTSGNQVVDGISYSTGYTGATLDVRVNACIIDAETRANGNTSGICDSSGEPVTQTIAAQMNIGDVSLDKVEWRVPPVCTWSMSSAFTGGTDVGILQYANSKISGGGVAHSCTIQNVSGTNHAKAVYLNSGNGYFEVGGLDIRNAAVPTSSGAAMLIQSGFDNSYFHDISVENYMTSGIGILIGNPGTPCCSLTLARMTVYQNNTGGIPLDIEGLSGTGNPNGLEFFGLSLGHPAASTPLMKINNTNTPPWANYHFYGLYEEGNTSDTTTAFNQITNGSAIVVSGAELKAQIGSSTAPAFSINGTSATALSLTGLSMPFNFTLPAVAILNNITGLSTPTDANGNLDTYPKGSALMPVGADTGAANAYVVANLFPPMTSYAIGNVGCFKAANLSTLGNPTVNFNGLGTKTIVRINSLALAGNDITTGMTSCMVYDGTNFDLLNPQARTGTGAQVLNTAPVFATSIGFAGAGTHFNTQAASTDVSGVIAIASATSALHTFATNYTNAPTCTITPTSDPTSVGGWWVTSSISAVTANIAISGTITFNYHCIAATN
jgi:hypothetical protein